VNMASGPDGGALARRKKRHLDVCLSETRPEIEDRRGAGFDAIHFVHECLPEINAAEIVTETEFLGKALAFPFLISCMTGGALDGSPINISLAKLAEHARLALGLGSMRVLFHEPKAWKDFSVRSFAPDIPLLANIGAAQLAEYAPERIMEAARSLEADALVVHLNPGQESVQEGGDVDFRHVLAALSALLDTGVMPVLVKETGHGIRPCRVRELLARGVRWVDIAGAGGADWLQVELARSEADHDDSRHDAKRSKASGHSVRLDAKRTVSAHSDSTRSEASAREIAETFSSWGLPTALILTALRAERAASSEAAPLIASGGLKNGLDLAKALALGAGLGGMALPLIKVYAKQGERGLYDFVGRVHRELRIAMFMTGSRSLAALREAALYYDADFAADVQSLLAAEAKPSFSGAAKA